MMMVIRPTLLHVVACAFATKHAVDSDGLRRFRKACSVELAHIQRRRAVCATQRAESERHNACGVGRLSATSRQARCDAVRGGGVPSKFFVDKIASQFITLLVDEACTSKMTFKGQPSRVVKAADFGLQNHKMLPNQRMFAIDKATRPKGGVLLLDRDTFETTD